MLINPQQACARGLESHFACLSEADLKDGRLLALQRGMKFATFLKFGLVLNKM